MRTPESLEDAKAIYREEKMKFTGAVSTVAGSRWLTAVASALAISFGTTWAYAPDRLPNLSGASFATFGLPTDLDFGVAGEQAREAAEAAQRQDGGGFIGNFLAEHASWIPAVNGAVFLVCVGVLAANLWVMTQRRRYTRG